MFDDDDLGALFLPDDPLPPPSSQQGLPPGRQQQIPRGGGNLHHLDPNFGAYGSPDYSLPLDAPSGGMNNMNNYMNAPMPEYGGNYNDYNPSNFVDDYSTLPPDQAHFNLNDLTTGDSITSAGKTAGSKDTDDENPKDKRAKRRAAVAAASRATRAKRKKEMEELKQKNKRLEKERESYLNVISELQMKVQALRETGSIDLRMENDLLRAELAEHKKFLSHFRHVADGLPTTKTAKRVMLIQSADTAVSQVLGLISTSMVDPTWRHGSFRYHPQLPRLNLRMRFQRLPPTAPAKAAKRITFRVDSSFLPANPEAVAEAIWQKVGNRNAESQYSRFFSRPMKINSAEIDMGLGEEFIIKKGFRGKEKKEPDDKNDVKLETTALSTELSTEKFNEEKDRGRISVYTYRELLPDSVRALTDHSNNGYGGQESSLTTFYGGQLDHAKAQPSNVLELLMVFTGRHALVCHSSFPEAEMATYQQNMYPGNGGDSLALRNKPVEIDHSRTGTSEAIVMATTFTNPNVDEEAVMDHKGRGERSSTTPALLEGAIIRPCENGCYVTFLSSYPLQAPDGYSATMTSSKSDGIIDDEAFFTATWQEIVSRRVQWLCESFPEIQPNLFAS